MDIPFLTSPTLDLVLRSDPGLRDFFLGRLASLVARQLTTVGPGERKALGEETFSVYLDCLDLDLEAEARAVLEPLRAEARPAERRAANAPLTRLPASESANV